MIPTARAPAGGIPNSGIALVVANVIPIFGVVFANWDTFSIVFLYWLETAVIGVLTVLRMLTATGNLAGSMQKLAKVRGIDMSAHSDALERASAQMGKRMGGGAKLFLVPFFCVHFGIFMSVHLIFIRVLLGGGGGIPSLGGSPFRAFESVLGQSSWLLVSIVGLFGSHLYSYFTNYIGRGEHARTAAPVEMMRPYGRVVVMHLAIIFGAFISMALGSSLAFLLLLVVGKTVIDLKLHLREHRKRMEEPVLEEGAV